ncbi:MAG: hypothetical protein GXO06_03340 [Epsilonproteobacteria bacterium]|nr:hypothetical protein [Campylobacterota bacterium]
MRHINLYMAITLLFISPLFSKITIENGEMPLDRWRVIVGDSSDINQIFDDELNSSVIEFIGGGSYKLGATAGDRALNIKDKRFISWQMKVQVPYTIYVIADTEMGLRYLFYVSTPSRGLNHGLQNGIHHGLGEATIAGRWIRITRDLESDLEDAEPENRLIAVNGFIFNGGNGARVDNIALYNPKEVTYLSDAKEVSKVDINNSRYRIIQWRFKNFGKPEIIDTRGVIKNPEAFEFTVNVDTQFGDRELLYTLGEKNLGFIDDNIIHHALGDDRTVGSVWVEDSPKNKLGLWQGITRDLEEDIRDFEIDNRIKRVNYLQIKGEGLIKGVKLLSSVDMNSSSKTLKSDDTNSTSNCKNLNRGVGLEPRDILWLIFINLIFVLIYNRRRLI